jgi:hypothetical protein
MLKSFKQLKNLVLDFDNVYMVHQDILLDISANLNTLTLNLPDITNHFEIIIPKSVTILTINITDYCNIDLTGKIPNTVTNLTLSNYTGILSDVIPKDIVTLSLISCNKLDSSYEYNKLKTLSLISESNDIGFIPNSVTTLIFKYNCPLKLSQIPIQIQTLHIGQYKLEDGEVIKFPNIKTLTLGDYFNIELKPGSIPETVTELNLGSLHDLVLTEGIIPNSVKKLTFGDKFKQKLTPGMIPESVTELKLPHEYDHDLTEISKREGIKINQDYRSYICDLEFPDNVKEDILRGLNKPIC